MIFFWREVGGGGVNIMGGDELQIVQIVQMAN